MANSGVLGWKNTTLTHAAALFYRTGNIDWKEGSDAKCFLSVTDAMLTTLISDGSTQKITVDGALDVELGYFADKTPDVTFLRCEIATLPRATDTKAELYSIWQKTTKYYPGIKIVKKTRPILHAATHSDCIVGASVCGYTLYCRRTISFWKTRQSPPIVHKRGRQRKHQSLGLFQSRWKT